MKIFWNRYTENYDPRIRKPRNRLTPPDRWILIAVLILTLIGILMVFDSSVAIAFRDFSDRYYFVREQVKWLLIGFIALIICSRIDYHRWKPLALPLLMGTLLLLVLVFIPGVGIHALGARRWIQTGLFVFQPAELAKFSLVVYLSAWFSAPERGRTAAFLLLLIMVVGLVVLEPDLGTSIVILTTAIALYFMSGAPLWHFALLTPVMFLSALGLALSSPYRFRRLTTFLNPQSDPLGASYQIRQVLLALGSGGLFGTGIGQSRQKYEYLPEANTDSIFAIIAEEIGFIGSAIVILLFLFLIWRGFRAARRAPDQFGKLLASGVSVWIGIQTVINLSSMVALVPLTGVPLPLISYGGSSLIVTMSALGVLLNISRHRL